MSKLTFFTPTILDEAFIFTMGASIKKTDNPIGFFGTGLKYAIAGVLRLGGKIDINQPGKRYGFYKKTESLRGSDVDMVYCDVYEEGKDTQIMRCPMTLDYGKTWEPWMYLRELYSNTIDEQGEIVEGEYLLRKPTLIDGKLGYSDAPAEYTLITVDSDVIFTEWEARASFFLNKARKPIAEESYILEVYNGSSLAVFYKGINVAAKPTRSAYTYNLLGSLTLNENRTVDSYYIGRRIHLYVTDYCKDEGIIDTILEASCDAERREHDIPFNENDSVSTLFMDRALNLYKRRMLDMPTGLAKFCEKHLRDHEPLKVYKPCAITETQQSRFNTCIAVMLKAGLKFQRYEFNFSQDMEFESMVNYRHRMVLIHPKVLDDHNWESGVVKLLIDAYVHILSNGEGDEMIRAKYNDTVFKLITGENA